MDASDIALNLIRIPRALGTGGRSLHDLLKEAGYYERHDLIAASDIREALLTDPECIDKWISYSEDKRASAGWYITQGGFGFTVGYFSSGTGTSGETTFTDRIAACAAFIKKEIEDVRADAG